MVIIDHFDKYPLITQKYDYYILFKMVNLVQNNEHLTVEGLQKFLAIKASMYRGLPQPITAFGNITSINRPSVLDWKIRDGNWLAGFTTGDGSFIIRIIKDSFRKLGFKVQLLFKLSQHIRDEKLIGSLVDFLGCGNVSVHKNAVYFEVTSFSDLYQIIHHFFQKTLFTWSKTAGLFLFFFQSWS